MEPAQHLFRAVDSITSFGKVSQFTRPASPHPNHQFRFAYSKAKAPQLDFTRKQTQSVPTGSTADRLEPAETTLDLNFHLNESQDLENRENEEPHDLGRSGEMAAPPLSVTGVTPEGAVENSTKEASSMANAEHSAVPTSGVIASAGNARPPNDVAEPSSASPGQERSLPQKERPPQTMANKVSSKRQESTISYPLVPKPSSNGELLGILLSRFEAEQHSREESRATQLAKDIEIQDLKGVSQNLYEQLQSAKDRERAQQVEISELNETKQQWQHRIQKMNEYVQGLVKDHQRLRKEAKDIQDQQKGMLVEKASLETALKDVHHVVDQDRSRTKKLLLEARHEIGILEQTILDQDRQLRQNADLLVTERDRSQGLGDAITSITTSYQDLTKLFKDYREAIMEKLSDLLQRSNDQIAAAPPPHEDLTPMLDQCLQELRQLDTVKQEDFIALKTALSSYTTRCVGIHIC